jgi:hypothetical protein
MIDTYGLGAMVVLILLIVAALAIVMWLLNSANRDIAAKQINATPIPHDDGKFMDAFVGPIYDDGLEHLENAVDSLRNGLDIFDHGAYVEAAEEFIGATRATDEASRKFREVLAMVEDQEAAHIKKARGRLTECKQLRQGAKDLETACDAMISGKKDEARALIDGTKGLRKLVAEWKQGP